VKGTKTRTNQKKRQNQRIKEQQYRAGEREKGDGEIQMWEGGDRKQVLDGRRGKKVQNVL
jgi:hypothetical protein